MELLFAAGNGSGTSVVRTVLFSAMLMGILGSCGGSHLFVHNEYLDHSYLASCQVDTPDPRRCSPYCGQQLIVRWRFPLSYHCHPNLEIVLHLQMRDRTRREVVIPAERLWGTYVYRLLNIEYWQTGGVLTYRLEVRSGTQVVETWTHQVWTELIDLDTESVRE